MNETYQSRILAALASLLLVAVLSALGRRRPGALKVLGSLPILAGVAAIGLLAWIVRSRIGFPLHLDLMEGATYQHYEQLVTRGAVYPEPSPEFVALAYNPLFYVLAVPFAWVLGPSQATLRFAAVTGQIAIGVFLYLIVRRRTGSNALAFTTAGIYAAAYQVMDAYLDTIHSDSWCIAAALAGTYLLMDPGRKRTALGLALLVASFWFKQHGAWFAIGGMAWVTYRDGLRGSLGYWALVLCLGPLAYLLAGPALFGPWFHYFTWEVPREWMAWSKGALKRVLLFFAWHYPVLAAGTAALLIRHLVAWRRPGRGIDLIDVQIAAALLTGIMGAMDLGSSDNVLVAAGVFVILGGMLLLHDVLGRYPGPAGRGLAAGGALVSFCMLAYSPAPLIPPPSAAESYRDLIALLDGLGGSVFAPTICQLHRDFRFHPAAHWVALEDTLRRPHSKRPFEEAEAARRVVEAAIHPAGDAYILAHRPLGSFSWLEPIKARYELQEDFGDRFRPLRIIAGKYDHGWPRYLYRFRAGD